MIISKLLEVFQSRKTQLTNSCIFTNHWTVKSLLFLYENIKKKQQQTKNNNNKKKPHLNH